MELKRFSLKLIYKISYWTKDNTPLDNISWEERIIIVKAIDFSDAYEVAEKYALDYEKEYENTDGNIVKFNLAYMIDCFMILDNRLKNGFEVYSSGFFDASELEMNNILGVIYDKDKNK